MKRLTNSLLVLGIAFGPLFFAAPAHADTIQFTYYWTTREFTFTDQTVSVTVTNDITNKIGGNGEVIDTYRITLGEQVIEVTEKHGPVVYTFEIVGTQTLKLEGIDNGYWAGNYGPVMTIEVLQTTQQPVTESPTVSPAWEYTVDEGYVLEATAPVGMVFSSVTASYVAHEIDCGIDVSAVLSSIFVGTSSASVSATNDVFGDPCPGWYKKLVATFEYASASPVITESVTLSPSPEPLPTPTPSPEPAPSPKPVQPEPTPTAEPSQTPTVSSPTESPESTQSPSPTHSPVVEIPTESLPVELPPLPATSSPASPLLPLIVPSPDQSIEEPSETPSIPATEAAEITEETESDSVSGAIETAVTEAIGAAVAAVGELVEAFQSAGLDMTEKQREEAQDVVVSTIIVSQVATAASAAAVSARKIK